jgi:hypothetical protein
VETSLLRSTNLTFTCYHAEYHVVNVLRNTHTSSVSCRCISVKKVLGMGMWVWLCNVYKITFAINSQLRHWFPHLCTLFNNTFDGPIWTRATEMKPQYRLTDNANYDITMQATPSYSRNTSAWRCTYQSRNFIPCWRTDDCVLSGVNTSLLQVSEHHWGDPGGHCPPCDHFWWDRLNTEGTNATKDWWLTSHRVEFPACRHVVHSFLRL